VHHDVWDWDIPSHPLLVDITRDGKKIPVVVVLPKTGVVFVLHRDTGEPFHEIEERPVPTNGLPGDQLSPTQPFPVRPPPLMDVGLSPEKAWGFGFVDRNACRDKIASMRYGGFYTPPSEEGTVMYPMVGGGMNWGGGAFDPTTNVLVTPVAQMPFFVKLLPNDKIEKSDSSNSNKKDNGHNNGRVKDHRSQAATGNRRREISHREINKAVNRVTGIKDHRETRVARGKRGQEP